MLAHEFERSRDLTCDLIVDRTTDANATGIGQALEPGRHVDTVAQQVGTLDHDVAQVDAYAKTHEAILRQAGVALPELLLDFDGTAHRLYRAGKLGDHAVAGRTENTTAVAVDQPVNDLAMGSERAESRFLVHIHEPAVADRVGGKNCRKPSLNSLLRHATGFLTGRAFKGDVTFRLRASLLMCTNWTRRRGRSGKRPVPLQALRFTWTLRKPPDWRAQRRA